MGLSYCTAGQLVYEFSRYPDKVIMEKNGAENHMFYSVGFNLP